MTFNRRTILSLAGAGLTTLCLPISAKAQISASALADRLAPIGMGTWLTFNVDPDDAAVMATRLEVLKEFFAAGGGMIDSSPMYARAEAVLGAALERLDWPDATFSATKIWTPVGSGGEAQLSNSETLWKLPKSRVLDLVHVHNLVKWKTHLPMLREAQAKGRVNYIGLTTSHGRRHSELERLMKSEPMDAVQFTYNVIDREAEARLLPAAQDAGLAVIINRPFKGGILFDRIARNPLPDWAAEIDCENWAQIFLKFITSHPAVTCAIPATSQPAHMIENMGAKAGIMPDAAFRMRIATHIATLA